MAAGNSSMDWETECLLERDEVVVEEPPYLVEDFAWPDDKAHPLFIPWVVQQIFEYLPLKVVEKQQGVCKLWGEEAVKIIRKRKVMVFYEEEVIKYYTNLMINTFSFPHSAFEFHTCNLISNSKHMTQFWSLFGMGIKKVEFHQSTVDGEALCEILANDIPNLESLFLRNVPRSFRNESNKTFPLLKEVTFQFFPFNDVETRICLKEFFRAVPNLERIHFQPTSAPERIPNRMMDIVLEVLSSDTSLPRLSEIDVKLELKNTHITGLLTSFPFPLVKLEVVLKSNVKSSDFRQYLNVLSESLNYLAIKFPVDYNTAPNCFTPPITNPERRLYDRFLLNLTHLHLSNFIGPLKFISRLVNLRSLKLTGVNLEESVPNGFGRSVSHKLRSFKADTAASSVTIYRLASCFPTLKVLHVVGVDDDSIRTVYREMPFLTELVLTAGTFTDTGISGVSREVCLDMAETTTYITANPERLRLDLYIGSLPNLKTLNLHSFAITDLSIILGIISCPKLISLSLQSDEITDTGMRTMGNKMNRSLVFLDVSKCTGISEAGRFYVKEKLKGRHLLLEQPRPSSLQSLCNQKSNRYVVTIRGRRDREPGPRPPGFESFLIQDPDRIPRAVRERMLARRAELIYFHRHRDAAFRAEEEEILAGQVLGPGLQRQLLEEAHNMAALEINAGMLQEFRIGEQNEVLPRAPQLPGGRGYDPNPRGLEAQFIEHRNRIFFDMVDEDYWEEDY